MTRAETIAEINAKLANIDDERVRTVAEIVDDIATGSASVRELTLRELALLEEVKADFAAGRTYTVDDVRAHSDVLIQSLRDRSSASR